MDCGSARCRSLRLTARGVDKADMVWMGNDSGSSCPRVDDKEKRVTKGFY